jgi:hypothetical protein
MSDVILGDTCRKNFGINKKYDSDLNSVYKSYIDALEILMVRATYGNDINNAIITQELQLAISQDDIDNAVGEIKYKELEESLISFCLLHNVRLNMVRLNTSIVVTVNMLYKFKVDSLV